MPVISQTYYTEPKNKITQAKYLDIGPIVVADHTKKWVQLLLVSHIISKTYVQSDIFYNLKTYDKQ